MQFLVLMRLKLKKIQQNGKKKIIKQDIYFGGTKLGVGGLITAYKIAAKDAIENGNIILKELETHLEINFPYEKLPQIMSLIKQYNLQIKLQDFNMLCKLQIELPKSLENNIIDTLKNISLIEITILK